MVLQIDHLFREISQNRKHNSKEQKNKKKLKHKKQKNELNKKKNIGKPNPIMQDLINKKKKQVNKFNALKSKQFVRRDKID